ncbi:MAG: ADP-ribosylglycohydrolase family protein [Actinomycetota bacterium]|nr:ADP-ribosylglycohydrolase family protein [Actinomycetota bacterium]
MVIRGVGDRVAGALVGLAVGDALGAPYEFAIPGPTSPEMRGGGVGPWAPGEWTDDTQQAICVAQGRADPAAVGARLLEWYAQGPKDVGYQTRQVLAPARDASELVATAAALHDARPDNTAGNGSLMRAAPVALVHLGDDAAIARTARAVSALTHGDPLCGDACVLWCIAIDRAVREERLDGVHDGLARLDPSARRRWSAWIGDAYRTPPAEFVPNGYVVTALQAALAVVVQTPTVGPGHFADALVAAIAIGHDTDTVGAIAGSLLGARWGRSSVPGDWQAPLHGWPGLDADGIARLAIGLGDV